MLSRVGRTYGRLQAALPLRGLVVHHQLQQSSLHGVTPTPPVRSAFAWRRGLSSTANSNTSAAAGGTSGQQQQRDHKQEQQQQQQQKEEKEKTKSGGGAWQWYNEKLQTHPFPTKMLTSGLLFGAGDVLAQALPPSDNSKPKPAFDAARALRAAAFGFLFLGPLSHVHYNFLEWLVVRKLAVSPASPLMPVIKVALEQFGYWAPSILSVYYVSTGVMEGKNAEAIKDDLRTKLWPAIKANWVLWPATQLLNFRFVPVHLQLNVVLVVSLGWSCYLSRMSADTPTPAAVAASAPSAVAK